MKLAHPLLDHLGSVTAIADYDAASESTTVVATFTYSSFGTLVAQTGQVSLIYGFTGQETDAESDLMYYDARYYDPRLGRFVSEDPIGFTALDTNLYRYTGNNPINYVDPMGLWGDTWYQNTRYYFSIKRLWFISGEEPDPSKSYYFAVPKAYPVYGLFRQDANGDLDYLGRYSAKPKTLPKPIIEEYNLNKPLQPHQFDNVETEKVIDALQSTIPQRSLDNVQMALDAAGFLPVVGTLADVGNAGISIYRGKYGDAALDLLGAVPAIGDLLKGGVLLLGAAKYSDEAGDAFRWLKKAAGWADEVREIGHKIPWDHMTKSQRKAFQHSYSRHAKELGLPNWKQKDAESLRQQFNNIVGHIRNNGNMVPNPPKKPFKGQLIDVNFYEATFHGTKYYYYETLDGIFISAGKIR